MFRNRFRYLLSGICVPHVRCPNHLNESTALQKGWPVQIFLRLLIRGLKFGGVSTGLAAAIYQHIHESLDESILEERIGQWRSHLSAQSFAFQFKWMRFSLFNCPASDIGVCELETALCDVLSCSALAGKKQRVGFASVATSNLRRVNNADWAGIKIS
jgi:hypothetical protein